MSYDFGLQHLCQKWRLLFGTKKQNTDWMKKLPQMWMTWGLSFARLQEGQSQQRQVFARLETCMIYNINKNTDLGEREKCLERFYSFPYSFSAFLWSESKHHTAMWCVGFRIWWMSHEWGTTGSIYMHPDFSPRPRETMRNRHRQTSTRSSVGKIYNQQMWSPLIRMQAKGTPSQIIQVAQWNNGDQYHQKASYLLPACRTQYRQKSILPPNHCRVERPPIGDS